MKNDIIKHKSMSADEIKQLHDKTLKIRVFESKRSVIIYGIEESSGKTYLIHEKLK